MTKPFDYIGREIEVGDKIVWASQSGDSACLCGGEVTKVTPYIPTGRINAENKTHYKVQARRTANDKWEKDGRIVTLSFTNRIVVVEKKQNENSGTS